MPHIKSFKGIRPHPDYVADVVIHMEGLSVEQAKIVRENTPYSYVNMLVPKQEHRFLRGSRKELAYKKINENFEEFLEKGILIQDEKPSLYVYRIAHNGVVQTGIWTITSIDDYLDNTIKKHELTRAEREAGLIEYMQQTGIDANPVLITYPPDATIKSIIRKTTQKDPCLNFFKSGEEHWLWKIDHEGDIQLIVDAFKNLPVSYIADGHHRAAAACTSGIERRKLNLKHTGTEEYNFFTSVYIATDELVILGFHRLIKELNISSDELLNKLEEHFELVPSNELRPSKLHEFGMYIKGSGYILHAKRHTINTSHPVDELDVTILQQNILSPILGINDPRTDKRISFSGGVTPVTDLIRQVDEGNFEAVFFLFPVSVDQLINVANAGEVMPPKSTWIEPKFLTGLLINQVN